MQIIKITFIHVLLLIGFVQGYSQAKISGNILDENNEVIPFATVLLLKANDSSMVKGQISDINGSFVFPNIPKGDYFVESTFIGYEKKQTKVLAFSGSDDVELRAIIMESTSEQLDEVVVQTERELIEVQPDKTVFNVEGSINAKGNTALELLRKSPGVVVDNNENLMIQGKSGVLVYIDGKRSPLSSDDLAIYLKNLQSDQVDAIEIITNPSAKYDAEGNAGIINIRLVKDKNLGTNGSVNLGFRYGINPKYNTSFNFNNRTKKLNTFGSYSLFSGENENEFFFNARPKW